MGEFSEREYEKDEYEVQAFIARGQRERQERAEAREARRRREEREYNANKERWREETDQSLSA